MTTTILKGHVSPETAYVVNDYPYGRTIRCKIRYWLEFKPKKGFRFMSQTTNPKRPDTFWNKPKASTYSMFGGCMVLNVDNGHVEWRGLSEFSTLAEAKTFLEQYREGMPEHGIESLEEWIKRKTDYEQRNKANRTLAGVQ